TSSVRREAKVSRPAFKILNNLMRPARPIALDNVGHRCFDAVLPVPGVLLTGMLWRGAHSVYQSVLLSASQSV
ncbi:hypothetical protein, partial [Nocardia sp. NPDC059239]|uniref:hypothetical protein n=1 Tax=unclassified Nocardia TaxID=2637762 RepID=UPI0036B37842